MKSVDVRLLDRFESNSLSRSHQDDRRSRRQWERFDTESDLLRIMLVKDHGEV